MNDKAILKNSGAYMGMHLVSFPVAVSCVAHTGRVEVPTSEIIRIGGVPSFFVDDEDPWWPFDIGESAEIELK